MNRLSLPICCAVIVAALAPVVSVRAEEEDGVDAKPHRLVVSMAGVSPREGTERFWSHGMTQVLAERLEEVHALRLRSTMPGRRKLGLKRGIPFTKEQAVEIGLLVESQRVLHGILRRSDGAWNLRMAVVTPATEAEERSELTAKDWWGTCDEATRWLLDHLGVRLEEEEEEVVFHRWTDSAEALEAVLRAHEIDTETSRMDEIEALLLKAIEADGDSAYLWASLGGAQVNLGKLEEAAQAAGRALALDPGMKVARLTMGFVESSRGNSILAAGHYRNVLKLDPESVPALTYLAMQLAGTPDGQQEALALLRRAKAAEPTQGQVFSVESAILVRLGRNAEAEASLREAIRLAEGEPPLFNEELSISNAAMALRDLPLVVMSTRRAIEAERATSKRPETIRKLEEKLAQVEARMKPVPVEAERPRSLSPADLRKELERRLTPEELARVEIPMSVTPEMVSWAAKWLEGVEGDLEKARALFAPMARRGGDRRTLGARSAKEVFAAWKQPEVRFSCQEYAKLYIGLGRKLGLDVFMASVWQDFEGDFVHHACAAVIVGGRCYLVDPTYLWFGIPHREFSVLDDVEAVALHCSQESENFGSAFFSDPPPLPAARLAEKLDPDDAYIKLAVAYSLLALGRIKEAKESLDAAEALQPERWDVRIFRGMMARKEEAPEDAQRWFEEALRLNPKAGDGHYMLGRLLFEKGELAEARDHLRKAIVYGDSEKNADRARRGIAQINELIGQSPGSPMARGLELAAERDWEGAAREFQRAVDEQPDSVYAHGRLGVALVNLGRLPEGIEHLRRSLELQPEGMVEFRAVLATFLYNEEGFEAARKVVEAGLALDPDASGLHEMMGELYLKEERVSESLESYRKALESDPGNTLAAIELAGIHAFSGRFAGAEEFLGKIDLSEEVKEPKQLLKAAVIIMTLGDVARAVQLAHRGRDLAMSGDDPEMMPSVQAVVETTKGALAIEERLLALLRGGSEDAETTGKIDALLEKYGGGGMFHVLDEDAERCFAKRRDEVLRRLGERETTTITVKEGAGARERVDEIRKALVGGASIEDAAGGWETAELARVGARGWNTRDDYVPVLRTPVFTTEVGGITRVIDGGKFFAVVVVHAARPAKGPLSLDDAAVRPVVHGLVMEERSGQWKARTLKRLRERVRKEQEHAE